MDRLKGLTPLYIQKLFFKLAIVLLIVGGLNWLAIGVFDTNMVSALFGDGVIATTVYILVGVSALTIMFYRDTYLPFLGETLAPCSVLQNREPPGATKEVKLIIAPNTKVLYWAAEPANEKLKEIPSWKEAYGKYENAGVATSNGEGVVVLKVRDPQSYTVPFKGQLDAHVHYRVCGEGGFMERVNTAPVYKRDPEGFEDEKQLGDFAAGL
jgi:uncharacterized membrane protein YuzA (DUF378 family)